MLLQTGHSTYGLDHTCSVSKPGVQTNQDLTRYLDVVQDSLKEGWSVHASKDGRLYYCK